ncbi:putative uncharacterized protein DDB_G0286901 isoform X1 [Drosophila ficusphila]|uniref:putative uncharacterized protein DDB_G0286901 isoform X1 n=1 Tax=Drosophila ficusphila TaxID=30025 RepID=UPI001C8A6DC4|nr:putative uncharacterized protein DDB_G0286901 isoform X1 [Drosophila ficusphila]
MSRRSNFIEGNDNFREQNLRFVRNEFEDNINQFFGGANPGGNGQQKPPPRDSLIVQPTAGNSELDNRRQFLRDLGASRMLANALANRTMKLPNFNLRNFQRQRYRLSVELGDSRQDVVDKEVLRAIEEVLENQDDADSRPRTPSPPRNIDWHSISRDNSPMKNDRSRPRNRQNEDNFQGQRKPIQEQINRSSGPINAPVYRNHNMNRNHPNSNPGEFNRNANSQEFSHNNRNGEFNRNNRNGNQQDFNRNNRTPQEFNRNNRNQNNEEFNRNKRNVNPPEFDRNHRNIDEFNRNSNRQEFNRSNGNPHQQEFNRPNRNSNAQEFNRPNRNTNPPNLIATIVMFTMLSSNRNVNDEGFNQNNRYANNDKFNPNKRNVNQQALNRSNRNSDEFNQNSSQGPNRNNRYGNPQHFNRNQEQNLNNQNTNNNNRGQPPNMRYNPSNSNTHRIDNNRGPGNQDFVPNQQTNFNRNAVNNQRGNIDDSVQMSRKRFHSPENYLEEQQDYIDEDVPEEDEEFVRNPEPQIGRNYQRIVNNNQITLCRTDLIEVDELNERNFDDNFQDDDDDRNRAVISDDHFRGPDQDNFRGRGFNRNNSDNFDRNPRGNQPIPRDHINNDRNSYGRGRNDRNFDDTGRQFDHELDNEDVNDDFNQRNNYSRGTDTRRLPPRESDTFRGSNKSHFPPNQYQHTGRGSGSGDGYRDNSQSNRPNLPPRNAKPGGPNQRRTNASLDRNVTRNYSPGRSQQRNSSLDRNPRSNINPGGANQHRSNSLTTQKRITSKNPDRQNTIQDRPNESKPKPNQVRDGKPIIPSEKNKKTGVTPNNRGSIQSKSNQSAIQAKNTTPGAQKPGQQLNKVKPRAGQKREAETAGITAPNKAKKANPKRQKVVSGRSFIIAGIRLPYINNHHRELPQPEEESLAVTFFEQTPIYNTNIFANNDGDVDEVEDEDDASDTESLDSNSNSIVQKSMLRIQMRREWVKIYKNNNYKDWHNWWRDYKWCGSEINKKLEKFGDRNLRHCFVLKSKPSTEDVVSEVFKQGHMGLAKNTFSHYRNMRSIYLLMNETFLDNLSEEQIERLQDLIRCIPNHLWLYKIRSMIYLWDRYHGILKSPAPKNAQKAKEIESIAREWKNPVFHWLAKQAFDELKAISEINWPDHKKIYPGLKS